MKRSRLLQEIFMAIVIFSLFAPSVVPLLQPDSDRVVAIEIIEEEHKQESLKKLKQKDVFFNRLSMASGMYQDLVNALVSYYTLNSSDHSLEIPIPPPEHFG